MLIMFLSSFTDSSSPSIPLPKCTDINGKVCSSNMCLFQQQIWNSYPALLQNWIFLLKYPSKLYFQFHLPLILNSRFCMQSSGRAMFAMNMDLLFGSQLAMTKIGIKLLSPHLLLTLICCKHLLCKLWVKNGDQCDRSQFTAFCILTELLVF